MKVIYNPTAGNGKSGRRLHLFQNSMKEAGLLAEMVPTERPGHAAELARQFCESGERRIVVMGGDGTIGEAVNGMVGGSTELGLVPLGTGNDLARSLGIKPNDVPSAVQVLATGQPESIDIGWERDRLFVLMAALGYPALVSEETNRMRRLKGSLAFFASVYKALRRMQTITVAMTLDSRTTELECTSILVQNTPYCGGGQLMAPNASLQDGQFDVVVIGPIGKLDLMMNFPKVYSGRHVDHWAFTVYRAHEVRIEPTVKLKKMFDGDLHGESPLEARSLRRALRVVVPLK